MPLLGKFLFIANNLILPAQSPLSVQNPAPDLWFSNSSLIEAQSFRNKVVIIPKKPGLLHVYGLSLADSQVVKMLIVSPTDFAAFSRCPKRKDYNFSTQPVSLESEAAAAQDQSFLREIKQCGFESFSLSPAQMSASATRFAALENEIAQKGFRILTSRDLTNQRELTVSGTAEKTEAPLRRALGDWAPFYALKFVDGPKPGRTLIFQLTLFQFSRSKAMALGLKLPDGLGVDVNAHNLDEIKVSGPSFNLGADFGEAQGIGRVLARPQIRTKPGEKALFQSGGEIPIRQSNSYSASTSWKNYGLQLELTPDGNTPTGANEISLSFKLELSEPDMNLAADGVPGLTVRRLESRFDLRVGEATVLSTMIQTRSGTRKGGPAGLSSLPILGSLFSNHTFIEQDSELWFAIEPRWNEISSLPPKSYGTGI